MFRTMIFLNRSRGQDTYSYVTDKCGNEKCMKFVDNILQQRAIRAY